MSDLRIYIVFSKEAIDLMGGNRGKMCAMAGHAALHAWWNSNQRWHSYEGGLGGDYTSPAELYLNSGQATKICLIAETNADLEAIQKNYKDKYGTTLVIDAGKTVFKEPTLTCIGIGPINDEECGDDLKKLKVFI
jgi:peptidyl-tRNA hydrolase